MWGEGKSTGSCSTLPPMAPDTTAAAKAEEWHASFETTSTLSYGRTCAEWGLEGLLAPEEAAASGELLCEDSRPEAGSPMLGKASKIWMMLLVCESGRATTGEPSSRAYSELDDFKQKSGNAFDTCSNNEFSKTKYYARRNCKRNCSRNIFRIV